MLRKITSMRRMPALREMPIEREKPFRNCHMLRLVRLPKTRKVGRG